MFHEDVENKGALQSSEAQDKNDPADVAQTQECFRILGVDCSRQHSDKYQHERTPPRQSLQRRFARQQHARRDPKIRTVVPAQQRALWRRVAAILSTCGNITIYSGNVPDKMPLTEEVNAIRSSGSSTRKRGVKTSSLGARTGPRRSSRSSATQSMCKGKQRSAQSVMTRYTSIWNTRGCSKGHPLRYAVQKLGDNCSVTKRRGEYTAKDMKINNAILSIQPTKVDDNATQLILRDKDDFNHALRRQS